MRILHIDTGRDMRGGQWQVLRLLVGLRNRGHDSLLMASSGSPLALAAADVGLPVEPLSRNFPAADLVHAHDAQAHTRAAVFARAPLVVARRVAFPLKKTCLSRWKYRRAAHFIAVSQHVAAILAATGIPREKISVVYDGVPLLPPSDRSGAILAPASGDPQKGAGLAALGASEAGIPIQFSEDLEDDLRTARVMLYMTHSEGLGSGALLAMSAAVPVIASNLGGLPELITSGVNGILTENSPQEIAVHLRRLEQDPEIAAQLAAAARRTVQERFTVEQMVDATIAVYRRILHA